MKENKAIKFILLESLSCEDIKQNENFLEVDFVLDYGCRRMFSLQAQDPKMYTHFFRIVAGNKPDETHIKIFMRILCRTGWRQYCMGERTCVLHDTESIPRHITIHISYNVFYFAGRRKETKNIKQIFSRAIAPSKSILFNQCARPSSATHSVKENPFHSMLSFSNVEQRFTIPFHWTRHKN